MAASKNLEILKYCPDYYNILEEEIMDNDVVSTKIIQIFQEYTFSVDVNNKEQIEVISNDLSMMPDVDTFHLLTGINMGGKSTYLRQIGICVILAHIGCYIPATKAEIPIIDQIFIIFFQFCQFIKMCCK